jgi:hypothetical protein
LRLNENEGFGQYRGCGKDGTEQECRRDERHIHGKEGQRGVFGLGKRTGREKACVGALDQAHAGVIAKLHGNLAEASVDCRDMRGSVLKKAIGESAGRSTDIETGSSDYFDLPVG